MVDVIADVLPFALVITLSPIPIIAIVLMLLSPDPARASLAYVAGWCAGIAVAMVIVTVLATFLPDTDADASNPLVGAIQVALGLGLGYLAWRTWRKRPAPGADAELPSWMAAIDALTAQRALGLGFLLSALNPKHVVLLAPPGVALGSAGLDAGSFAVVIVIFTITASLSVLIPFIAQRVAPSAVAGPLQETRAWLVHNNATMMALIMFVIGANALGNGIGNLG